jgi:hypothetical protein
MTSRSDTGALTRPPPPLPRRVIAGQQVSGDPGVRLASRRQQHDLRPQPDPPARFAPRTLIFGVLRSDAVSVTGTAESGIHPPAGEITATYFSSRHPILARAASRRRQDGPMPAMNLQA